MWNACTSLLVKNNNGLLTVLQFPKFHKITWFEFVVRLQVREPPEPAVDDVRETFLLRDLEHTIGLMRAND